MKAFSRLRRPRDTGSPIISDEPRGEPRPEIIETRTLRWINIDEPRLADRLWLAENFPFHELDLEDVASHNQRPKVDEYDEYLFLVMQFPRFDKETGRLHAAELDIFIGPITSSPCRTTRSSRCPRSSSASPLARTFASSS